MSPTRQVGVVDYGTSILTDRLANPTLALSRYGAYLWDLIVPWVGYRRHTRWAHDGAESGGVVNIVAAIAILSQVAGGQSEKTISSSDERCACTVTLTRLTVLGARSDTSGYFGDTQSVAVDSRGRYYVLKPQSSDRVFIYDRDGAFVRTISDEHLPLSNVGALRIETPQVLHLFDNGTRTWRRFGPSGRPIGTDSIPGGIQDAIQIGTGVWVVNAIVREPARLGLPFLVLRNGRASSSFGSSTGGEYRPDRPLEGMMWLATRDSISFWSTPRTALRLSRWAIDGLLLDTLSYAPAWFAPARTGSRWSLAIAPTTEVSAFKRDSLGRLWLLVSVAAPTWRTALDSVAGPDGTVVMPTLWERALHTRVVVLEERSHRLLFDREFPVHLRQFLGPGFVVGLSGWPNGGGRLSVYSLSVTNRD